MTLQLSGPISLGNIQAEFGGAPNIALSEYYAGGSYVTPGTTGTYQGTVTAIPSSGLNSLGRYYGAASAGAPVYTPGTETYLIAPSAQTVNEGSAISWTITTSNVSSGTVLYWTNSGTTVASDFVQNTNSGSVTINGGTASFSLTLASDFVTEGTESINISLRTTSISGTIVANANSVVVTDTSTGGNLVVNITSSAVNGVDRYSSTVLHTKHVPNNEPGPGNIQVSGRQSGNGPFWIADQAVSTNQVYRIDARIPAGHTAITEWPSSSSEFQEYFDSAGAIVASGSSVRHVRTEEVQYTAYDAKLGGVTAKGYAVSNWGIYDGAFSSTRQTVSQTGLTGQVVNNQSCRIPGTPYVFLGTHYGNNTTILAVGTAVGQTGLNTACAISVYLYEADGTTLVTTNQNPFWTYIPAPNGYGWNGTSYVANVCWESTGADPANDIWRSNWIDISETGNNNSANTEFVGQLRTRLGNGTAFVLKFALGHQPGGA